MQHYYGKINCECTGLKPEFFNKGDTMSKLLSVYLDILKSHNLVVEISLSEELLERDIDCLTYDTREVLPNALFVCKGAHFKEEYADAAMKSGAVAYVSEKKYGSSDSYIIVSDVRLAMVYLAEEFYDHAPEKITSVGITGTKGKSTTAYYLRGILNLYMHDIGKPDCALISSIKTYDGVVDEVSHLTTPEAIPLHAHFNNAINCGITHLVMEVSSQALKYNRVLGINYDVACFTNIGLDHISPAEHKDFNDYFTSKLKIFDSCKVACINMDAQYSDEAYDYAKGKCEIVTYGSSPDNTIYCSNIEKRDDATFFTVKTPEFEGELCITMPGIFNVSNALAAIAMCYVLKIPVEYVAAGLKTAKVAGRMEVFKSHDKRISVIVDYAHNKMSFEAIFRSIAIEYPDHKVISVFGCPGDKAFLRRHDLGSVAGMNSDYIIVTEDDPGDEPFDKIATDIIANLGACPFEVIEDRGKAIRKAILDIEADRKVVILAGKGEETTQKRGTVYEDYASDIVYAQQFLKEYDNQ